MERGSRKRSSSTGNEKMESVGGRQEKTEGHCSTGQSPQWAVVPMEEDEEEEEFVHYVLFLNFQDRTAYLIKAGLYLDHYLLWASFPVAH